MEPTSKSVQSDRYKPNNRDSGKILCVGFSEIDKYAISIYQKHFPEHTNYGDAKHIIPEQLSDFDLLVGGFPCQAFSVAGKRGGFDDTRGTLFFEIARILKIKRPRMFLLENVKGLLSHDDGRTFKIIIATLVELGYSVEWQVLNSKNFGVPQNRERVFIAGYLGGSSGRKVFPIGENDSKDNELCRQQANCLTARYEPAQATGTYIAERELHEKIKNTQKLPDAQRIRFIDESSSTLKGLGGGQGAKTGLYAVPLKFLERNQKNYQGEYSFTVDTVNSGGILKDFRVRRLTPVECERLQSFPDNWTKYGVDGKQISDSQRYKVLGNAVTVNVIEEIIKRII